MHDTDAAGNEYFKCDFCRESWSESRPMVEGHKGSLICAPCLTVAYTQVIVNGDGPTRHEAAGCALCLLHKDAPHWISPMDPGVVICRDCLDGAARTFERDPESGWRRPVTP